MSEEWIPHIEVGDIVIVHGQKFRLIEHTNRLDEPPKVEFISLEEELLAQKVQHGLYQGNVIDLRDFFGPVDRRVPR